MIEIEFEKPNYTTCECCGNQVTWLTRFVYKDNEAIAFYYATFTEHAEKKEVKCLIGICFGMYFSERKLPCSIHRTAFSYVHRLAGLLAVALENRVTFSLVSF